MKKVLLLAALLLVLIGGAGAGVAWLVRRPAHAGPPEDEGAQSVSIQPQGKGFLLEIHDGGLPLRSLRWIGPVPGGAVVAQVATQSDRQLVALVKDGRSLGLLPVPRPGGLGEGLFNHAELIDAAYVEGDALVLLYRPLAGSEGDPAMVLALDLASRSLRWCHRAPGARLALGGAGKDAAVFLWGRATPVQRLPLALQKGEKEGLSPVRGALKPYEAPPEVGEIADLLPTGAWTFLVAHARGLSAFNGVAKGWNHLPAPPPSRLGFPGPKGALALAGKRYWWQPEPGAVVPVQADGTPIAEAEPPVLAVQDPALDAPMLKLLGGDAEGRLWFTLAAPALRVLPAPKPTAEGETPPAPAQEAPEFTSEELLAWETHLRGDLGRLYVYDPAKKTMARLAWAEAWRDLSAPEGFKRPAAAEGVRPDTGGALFLGEAGAWWLPLGSLPLQPLPSKAAEPAPAPAKAPDAKAPGAKAPEKP
jgi:hypothetical protein